MSLVVDRALRDFVRYTGDGRPNAPIGKPLPIGDPASGVHNPSKAELRAAMNSVVDAAESSAALAGHPFATRADLIAATIDPSVMRLSVFGVGEYERDAAALYPAAISNSGTVKWVPAGQVATPVQFGAIGNGVADDAEAFSIWLSYLYTAGVKGYIPEAIYRISSVSDRLVTGAVVIEAHSGAIIKGLATNIIIAGNGVVTSTIATFTAGALGYRVGYTTGGVETLWTLGVQYTQVGSTINWGAGSAPHGALAVGTSVRIISQNPIFEIGAASGFSPRFEWRGGTIDNSLRGYFISVSSGEALTIVDFDGYTIEGVTFQGASNYEIAFANKVSDSGFVPTRCKNGEVHGCKFIGQADLGIYITGGSLTTAGDDGIGHSIHSNHFYACSTGVSAKRQAGGVSITNNVFEGCDLGATLFNAGGVDGGKGIIANNRFLRCGRRGIDLRRTNGFTVTGNVITDYGYELDGATPRPNVAAINAAGASNGTISGNVVEYVNLTGFSGGWGIQLTEDTVGSTLQSDNVMVTNNNLINVHSATKEANTGARNIWTGNHIVGAAVEVDLPAGRRWHYRRGNLEFEGAGSQIYTGNVTPTLSFAAAAGSPVITYSRQYGRYMRRGNAVTCIVSVQATITHTETAKELRIDGLPFVTRDIANVIAGGVVNHSSNITFPAGTTQLSAEMSPETTYVRIRANGTGSPTAIITSSNITTGTSVRIDFTITYEAQPYGEA